MGRYPRRQEVAALHDRFNLLIYNPLSLGHLAQAVAGGVHLRAYLFGQQPSLRALPRARAPHHQKSVYSVHAPYSNKSTGKLILPDGDLRVDAAREVEDDLDHDEERGAAKRQRGDAGQRLHGDRQDRDEAQKERSDKGDTRDDVAEVAFSAGAGPHAGDKGAVFLQVFRYHVRVKGHHRVEVGKEEHEDKVQRAIERQILHDAEYPGGRVGEPRLRAPLEKAREHLRHEQERERKDDGDNAHLLLHLAAVADELFGRGEFAQAVPDHVLAHQHLDMRFAVVHAELKAHHLRGDLRAARPGLDRLGGHRLFALNLFEEFFVDVGSFFKRSRHNAI